MSSPALWGFLAALGAVAAEYAYRILPGPWSQWIWLWIPNQLVIGYSIYRLVTWPNLTLFDSFVYWSFSTLVLRTFASLVLLAERPTRGVYAAVFLVIVATLVRRWK